MRNLQLMFEIRIEIINSFGSQRNILKFSQNLIGSNSVNETYRIPSIGGGKKGEETNIHEFNIVFQTAMVYNQLCLNLGYFQVCTIVDTIL